MNEEAKQALADAAEASDRYSLGPIVRVILSGERLFGSDDAPFDGDTSLFEKAAGLDLLKRGWSALGEWLQRYGEG